MVHCCSEFCFKEFLAKLRTHRLVCDVVTNAARIVQQVEYRLSGVERSNNSLSCLRLSVEDNARAKAARLCVEEKRSFEMMFEAVDETFKPFAARAEFGSTYLQLALVKVQVAFYVQDDAQFSKQLKSLGVALSRCARSRDCD
jgi:hypothetical protein